MTEITKKMIKTGLISGILFTILFYLINYYFLGEKLSVSMFIFSGVFYGVGMAFFVRRKHKKEEEEKQRKRNNR